jgi:hypothetical protein
MRRYWFSTTQRSSKPVQCQLGRVEDRFDRRNDCDVIAQQREIADALALGLQYRQGRARHRRFEAEGEEDDLLVRVVARDLQRVERRIDDAHVGPVRHGLQQAFA